MLVDETTEIGSAEYRCKNDRYQTLVSLEFARGLTDAEAEEMSALSDELDRIEAMWYAPLITRLEAALARKKEG